MVYCLASAPFGLNVWVSAAGEGGQKCAHIDNVDSVIEILAEIWLIHRKGILEGAILDIVRRENRRGGTMREVIGRASVCLCFIHKK